MSGNNVGRRGTWAASVLGSALVGLLACSGPTSEEPAGEATLAVTAPTSPNGHVFVASGRISMLDRARITGGHIAAAAATGDAIFAGFDARVGEGMALLGRRVVLQDRAVAGDLFANQVVAPFATYASLSPFVTPVAPPPVSTSAAGSTPVTVNGGQSLTLAAGSYGQITINGTLRLSGGVYLAQNLSFGNDGRMIADAASTVRATGRVVGGDRVHIITASGLGAGDLRLVVAGATDTTGGVTLANDAHVTALVLSRARFQTGARLIATGAVAARDVLLGNDAQVAFQTGFECGSDAACDDGNACTTDRCVDGRCTRTPVANGSACSDGNACTNTDSCADGTCIGNDPVVCPAETACSNAGVCNTATGLCSATPKADGTACSDGNACTRSDACQGGFCVGQDPVVCAAATDCRNAGVCNTGTGLCSSIAKPNGTACSDADACTQGDSCQGGFCQAGAPLVCNDGLFCNGFESCDASLGCVGGAPPNPDDAVACTVDTCNENTDAIEHAPDPALCPAGTFCSTVLGCTNVDECREGTDNCSDHATCTDTDGGFTCACKAGYSGDGVTCNKLCTPMIVGAGVERCVLVHEDGGIDLFMSPSDTEPWKQTYDQGDEPQPNQCGPTAAKNIFDWYGIDEESYGELSRSMNTNTWDTERVLLAAAPFCAEACFLFPACFAACEGAAALVADLVVQAGTLPDDFEDGFDARMPSGYVRCAGEELSFEELEWSLARGNPVAFLESRGTNNLHWAAAVGIYYVSGVPWVRIANAADVPFGEFNQNLSLNRVSGPEFVEDLLADELGVEPSTDRWSKIEDATLHETVGPFGSTIQFYTCP
jgi:hypothetical protein